MKLPKVGSGRPKASGIRAVRQLLALSYDFCQSAVQTHVIFVFLSNLAAKLKCDNRSRTALEVRSLLKSQDYDEQESVDRMLRYLLKFSIWLITSAVMQPTQNSKVLAALFRSP